MEFSKRIVLGSYLIAAFLTFILIIGILLNLNTDGFVNVVLAAWAEVTAANAFYLNKAKAENKIKIAKSITDEEADRIEKISGLL